MNAAAARAAFREWFGLTPTQADLLSLLYGRRECLTLTQLAVLLSSTAPSMRQAISEVRRALEAEAIDTLPGEGYQLTDEGRAECRVVLAQLAQELLAAGA